MRLKGKFYRNVVRPAMYKCWVVDEKIEHKKSIAEMRMLR